MHHISRAIRLHRERDLEILHHRRRVARHPGGEHIMPNDMKIFRALVRKFGAVTVKAALREARRREA